MSVSARSFGNMPDGSESHLFTITNRSGAFVSLCDYGARIVSITVPDRDGVLGDIVWGYEDVSPYCALEGNAGAVCGRVAARIQDGAFTLDGVRYELSKNENGCITLHGGQHAFDTKLWGGSIFSSNGVVFTYISPDLEEGFPGTLAVNVMYTFTDDNRLIIEYRATSDRDTICSLTNHTYFNLAGHGSGSVLGQQVEINADYYLANGSVPMATGAILPVDGTPMDYRTLRCIGDDVDCDFDQISRYRGYNHTYALNKSEAFSCEKAAVMYDPVSGRQMDIYTSMPGLHFFSANKTTPRIGKNGVLYNRRFGLCFETQFFPNAFKCPWFISPVLRKEHAYIQRTEFRFSAR